MQWATPAADGDSEVLRYELYGRADFESAYSQVYSGMALQSEISGLLTGFYYQFKIRSVNALGASDFSSASVAVLTALKPAVPTGLTLVSRSDSMVEIKWEAPVDRGGIKLTGFNIYMATAHDEYSQVGSAPSTSNPTITYHTETPLVPGETYRFKVSAVNFVGEGDITEAISVIAADLPEAPGNPPVATLVTETSISLSIAEISSSGNGGSPITGYIVQIDDGSGGDFTAIHDSLTDHLIVSGLDPGKTYRTRYTARNIVYDADNMYACDSLHFSPSLYVLTAVKPAAPRDLRFDPTIRYKQSLIYRWEPPLTAGGSPLQVYTLEIEDVSSGSTVQHQVAVQATSYRFDNLDSAKDYAVRMKVNNLVDESDWTD